LPPDQALWKESIYLNAAVFRLLADRGRSFRL